MGCTIGKPSKEFDNEQSNPADTPAKSKKSSKSDKRSNKSKKQDPSGGGDASNSSGTDQETVTMGVSNSKETGPTANNHAGSAAANQPQTVAGAAATSGPSSVGARIVSQLDLDLEKVELIEDTVRDNLALLKGSAYNPDDELIINNQNCEELRAAARANASGTQRPMNGQSIKQVGLDHLSMTQANELNHSSSMLSMTSVGSNNPSYSANTNNTAPSSKSTRAYRNVYVGLKLMCRDEFQSKYTKKLMHRWREIEVIEVQGNDRSQLFVHFVGWANTFDHWVDLHKDSQKIAALNILTKEEIETGKMLTDDQILATKEFLIYGEIRTKAGNSSGGTAPERNNNGNNTKPRGLHSEKSFQSSESEGEILDSFFIGMKLDVLDVYYKRGSDKPHHKWREAQVININGNKIKINYLGWDSKFDESLDVVRDKARIARHLSKAHRRPSSHSSEHIQSNGKAGDSDNNSVISVKKTNSFLKKFDPEGFLKKLNIGNNSGNNTAGNGGNNSSTTTTNEDGTEGGGNGSDNDAAILDTTFLGSRFGRRILNKLKIKMPQGSGNGDNTTSSNGRKSSKKRQEGGTESNSEENDVARFAAQFNDPSMKTSAQLAAEIKKEKQFIEVLAAKGLTVVEIEGDGNCMFRAISHQLFLNEDQHEELRKRCVDHLIENKARFAMFCFDDFDEHVECMKQVGVWGDELELRALEEIIDRPIRIFSSDAPDQGTPLSNNFEELTLLHGVVPITLSYHGSNHYNSVNDASNPLPLRMRNTHVLFKSRQALFGPNVLGTNTENSNNSQGSNSDYYHQQQQLQMQHSSSSASSRQGQNRANNVYNGSVSGNAKVNAYLAAANTGNAKNRSGGGSSSVRGDLKGNNSSSSGDGVQQSASLTRKSSRKNMSSGASVVSTANSTTTQSQRQPQSTAIQLQQQHYAQYQQQSHQQGNTPAQQYSVNSVHQASRNNQNNAMVQGSMQGMNQQPRNPHIPSNVQIPPANGYNIPTGYSAQTSPRGHFAGSSSPNVQMMNAYPNGPAVFTFQNGNLPPAAGPASRQVRSTSITSPPSAQTDKPYYPAHNNSYR